MIDFSSGVSLKILVTNDDAIHAPGLWALVQELKQVAELLVVAPDREQSAVGTSFTLHRPLQIKRKRPPIKGIETYAVNGTPTDSVVLALGLLAKDKVDMVFSGINKGSNLGNDVFISGTVGAALQGYFYGLPAIAISVKVIEEARFDVAAKLAGLLARMAQQGSLPRRFLWNINLPDLPLSGIRGIEITRLGHRSYREDIKEEGRGYYRIVRENPEPDGEPGTDIQAVTEGIISITPLQSDLTATGSFPPEELCHSLFQKLRLSTA